LSQIVFITGTDTGVGKTLLTASLLFALRRQGVRALAMKPFCSGGWQDVDLLQAVQGPEPKRELIAPYYFPEPLAPFVATMHRKRRHIRLEGVKKGIEKMARRCERLLVEGAGGVLVPLGRDFAVADLIGALACDVVVVAPNKLGVINHTRLTVEALRARGVTRILVVLMEQPRKDPSARTNAKILKKLVECRVEMFPYLGPQAHGIGAVKQSFKKLKKVLARIGDPDSFCAHSSGLESGATKRLSERRNNRRSKAALGWGGTGKRRSRLDGSGGLL
jgi:dethiobiotin synthetase